jgi:hypothetical protein
MQVETFLIVKEGIDKCPVSSEVNIIHPTVFFPSQLFSSVWSLSPKSCIEKTAIGCSSK